MHYFMGFNSRINGWEISFDHQTLPPDTDTERSFPGENSSPERKWTASVRRIRDLGGWEVSLLFWENDWNKWMIICTERFYSRNEKKNIVLKINDFDVIKLSHSAVNLSNLKLPKVPIFHPWARGKLAKTSSAIPGKMFVNNSISFCFFLGAVPLSFFYLGEISLPPKKLFLQDRLTKPLATGKGWCTSFKLFKLFSGLFFCLIFYFVGCTFFAGDIFWR